MTTRIDVTLEGLHQLRERIDRQQLEGEDWVVVGALVSTFIARTEARQARLRAKAAQQAAQEKAKQTAAGPVNDVGHSPDADATAATGRVERARSRGTRARGSPPGMASRPARIRRSRIRRRRATVATAPTPSATRRKHVHTLAAGIIGAICALCGVGRVFRYRDKVIIRVVGQPIFAAVRHHFEQGRCRLCGAIITAEGSEPVLQGGIGTSYITLRLVGLRHADASCTTSPARPSNASRLCTKAGGCPCPTPTSGASSMSATTCWPPSTRRSRSMRSRTRRPSGSMIPAR